MNNILIILFILGIGNNQKPKIQISKLKQKSARPNAERSVGREI